MPDYALLPQMIHVHVVPADRIILTFQNTSKGGVGGAERYLSDELSGSGCQVGIFDWGVQKAENKLKEFQILVLRLASFI